MSGRRGPLRAIRRMLGRDEVPEGFTGVLAPDERVLATAALTGGGDLVVTSWGMWVPEPGGPAPTSWRRVGWHRVSRAAWAPSAGAIELVEADEEPAGAAVVLTDRPVRRLRLASPGAVPETVHRRVTASIRSRHHRDLPGGGAWFVQRRIAGTDGFVLQVRPDPGTDPAVVAQVAADAAAALGIGAPTPGPADREEAP